MFIKNMNQTFVQKTFLGPHKRTVEKLSRVSVKSSTAELELFLELDQPFEFWSATKVSELCPNGQNLSRSWINRAEQPHQEAD